MAPLNLFLITIKARTSINNLNFYFLPMITLLKFEKIKLTRTYFIMRKQTTMAPTAS
jgi:hypothetical protein